MIKLLKIFLPIVIIFIGLQVNKQLSSDKKSAGFAPPPAANTQVEAMRAEPTNYQPRIVSRGLVQPRTSSRLIPEVSGTIVEVSPSFFEGRFFNKGDILIQIDDRDYVAARFSSEASLAQTQLLYEQEKAQVEQARIDWERLNPGTEAPPLVGRTPQLAKAEADMKSAEAQLEAAIRNLERTQIRAPYDGRIRAKNVDVGQYVSPGTVIAEIFATDYIEIRLPIRNQDLAFLDLPETYSDNTTGGIEGPGVNLFADYGGQRYSWQGQVVRAEGVIDSQSRQLFVVVQVDDPYASDKTGKPPLKVGLFVEALIDGTVLDDVYAIPNKAVLEGDTVVFVGEGGVIERREFVPLWTDENMTVMNDGIETGEAFSLTPLPFTANGATVNYTIEGEAPAAPKRMGPGGRGSGPGMARGPGGERPSGGKPGERSPGGGQVPPGAGKQSAAK
ncbi:MAG: efflux RND transporter periplasmic adaptor subunit [Verrucomicrobiota bacterium]